MISLICKFFLKNQTQKIIRVEVTRVWRMGGKGHINQGVNFFSYKRNKFWWPNVQDGDNS